MWYLVRMWLHGSYDLENYSVLSCETGCVTVIIDKEQCFVTIDNGMISNMESVFLVFQQCKCHVDSCFQYRSICYLATYLIVAV